MADVCRTNDQSLNHTQQDTILSFAGNAEDGRAQNGNQMMCLPGPPHYKALLPAILPGTRCYADSSTAPDITLQVSRSAGLGMFIVNGHTSTTSTIYVKAVMGSCNTVIMVEAAALALGAQILKALNVQQPFFLSDNQQLVTFFNGDHINPPYWDIKPFTQAFINISSAIGGKIFKVDRNLNTTAHVLASQAYHYNHATANNIQFTCTVVT